MTKLGKSDDPAFSQTYVHETLNSFRTTTSGSSVGRVVYFVLTQDGERLGMHANGVKITCAAHIHLHYLLPRVLPDE